MYAQETAPGGSGALSRVLGRPPSASAAALTSVVADYVVPTKVCNMASLLFNTLRGYLTATDRKSV